MHPNNPRSSASRGAFRLGEWLVEPSLNRVGREGDTRQVEPRVMDVLAHLASRPGEVFTRGELLEQVWSDVVVGEEALTRAISEIRRVLDDDHRSPRFVETIRKGGYRLVERPRPVEPAHDSPPAAVAASPTHRTRPPQAWTALAVVAIAALVVVLAALRGGGETEAPAAATTMLRATPVTSFAGREEFPAISPDGRHVAFAWAGEDGQNVDVYVRQVGAESLLRLTDDPGVDTFPRWSPDGLELVYLHADEAGQQIRTVPLIGGRSRGLLELNGACGGYDWSPDGKSLVLSESDGPGAPYRLYLLEPESGERRPLGVVPDGAEGDIAPVFSPDGSSVAFVRVDGSGLQDVYLLSMSDGAVRRLTHGLLQVRGIDWERDGESLLCSAVSSAFYFLWRVDIRDGSTTRLPTRGEWIHYPTAARHADRLVYQDISFEKNIWRVRREDDPALGLSTDALITSTRWDCEAVYSPDGGRIAFTSARSGSLEVWVAAADGSDPYPVTRFGSHNVGAPRWSPDGSRLAFHASAMESPSLFVVDADGGSLRRLTDGSRSHLMSGWSRDSRWLYFGSDQEGSWDLWKLRVDDPGGEVVRVTRGGGIAGHESADGRFLYFARPDRAGLWRLDLQRDDPAAEPETILADLPQQGDWGNWGLADAGIVLARRDPEGPMLLFHDFATGELAEVTRVPNIAVPSLGVSPDGRSILYARLEHSRSDVMLVDGYR